MSTEKQQGLLQKIWSRTEEVIDEIKSNKASKNLQLAAERHVMESLENYENAESNFETSILEARETKDFSKIVSAKLALLTAEKKKEEAISVYKDLFESDPKFID